MINTHSLKDTSLPTFTHAHGHRREVVIISMSRALSNGLVSLLLPSSSSRKGFEGATSSSWGNGGSGMPANGHFLTLWRHSIQEHICHTLLIYSTTTKYSHISKKISHLFRQKVIKMINASLTQLAEN